MGEASRFLAGPAKCEVFNEANPGTFLTCNTSRSFPQCSLSSSFLHGFAEVMLPLYTSGGIVFGVSFGEVCNGVVAESIKCIRATPVTYYHDRRTSPLDAVCWPRDGLCESMLDVVHWSRYDRRNKYD
jgi:hypothetical protein